MLKADRKPLAVGLATVALCVASPHAAAQLEEVVVSARKVEERLQDVPLSISAFTDEQIASRGLRDVTDVARFTPGFALEKINRYGAQGGTSRPVIRGMSNILGEANASVFVDGILYSDSILSFPFDIVERVEVIKGPQAALFGRSTFSGAINLVTKKGSNVPEHRVSLRAAEWGDYEANVLSRGAIVEDKLFYMAHARYYTFDGMYRNTIDGGRVGQEESYNVNGSLEYRSGGVFTGIFSGGFTKDDDGLAAVALQDRFYNNCFLDTPRQYYCGDVTEPGSVTLDRAGLQGTEGLDRESTRLSAQLIFDFDSFRVTSSTGLFFTDTVYGYDSTYQAGSVLGPTTVPGAPGYVRPASNAIRRGSTLRNEVSERDEWSTELRVESDADARVRFMGGAFFYQNRRTLEERHFADTAPTIDQGEDRIDNWAVFGAINADLTDRWNATVELRYAEDTIGNRAADGILLEEKFDSVSPRLTTSFKVTPDTMIYANVAKGNKPGIINGDPRLPDELMFADEEQSWNYEIGVKNELIDGRLIANVALFYTDWDDQQMTDNYELPSGTTLPYLRNAGKSRVQGVELELQAAFTDNFTGGFTYAYTNAEFVEFFDSEAEDLFGNGSVKGKQLPNVPENQASLYAKASFPFGDRGSSFFVRGDTTYMDTKYTQMYNLAGTGEQTLVNLGIGLESDHWNVTLFVDNLTDDRTPATTIRYVDQLNLNVPQFTNANPAQDNVPGSTTTERAFEYPLGARRQVGITASYRF